MPDASEEEPLSEAALRAKVRRQVVILLAVINVLILLVGLTTVADLQRLRSPRGVGLRWLQAALFGDCKDYLTYSLPDPSRPETRTHDQFCSDLRAASAAARAESARVGPTLRLVAGDRVQVQLIRGGVTKTVAMHVVKRDGRWRVLRDELTCSSVGCA